MSWRTDFVFDKDWDKPRAFEVADGDHKVTICGVPAEETTKKGAHMIKIPLSVEGSNGEVYQDVLVEGEYFDRNASRLFSVFHINIGDWNYARWTGHTAYAHFEHREEKYVDRQGQERTSSRARLLYYHNTIPESVQAVLSAVGGSVTQDSGSKMPIY